MNYPQSTAKEIGKNCEAIGKWGCLAMCYIYCMGIESEIEYLKIVNEAMEKGILDNECTVTDPGKYIQFITGRKCTVTKKKITSIEDIKGPYPVSYDYNGNRHWVVVENGKIVFNSLMNSVCVSKGKPTEARIIKLA